ncbi:MAG: zinc-ribbon domain-containing protein [Candidatus Thorarchaeota archaeon]
MNRWYIISIISILLTALMILLWFLIPGFPLFIFFFLPPLFCWGLSRNEEEPTSVPPAVYTGPHYCSQCGKQLLEPKEMFCPRCGTKIIE